MGFLGAARVQANEVVKAVDITYGFDAQIDNVIKLMQGMLEAEQDFVINGIVKPYVGGGMNVSINPILGVCKSTGISFINTDTTEQVGISEGWDVDRIDIIEVAGEYVDTTLEQRAFIDFDTKQKNLLNVNTRKELRLNIFVKHNENDGQYHATAPNTSNGFVKLCEIFVPAHAVDISECTIYNITADVSGEDNEGWTKETSKTYNIGYISDVNKRFREEHKGDGTHKNSIIHQNNLDTGTGQNQVNGNNIPLGGSSINLNGTSYSGSESIRTMINALAIKVTDLFNDYLKNGAFNFKGELCLSEIIDEESNLLSKALKLGADGEGNAYCKVGENTIFTISESGTIKMAEGYTAQNSLDLITKSVTDALNTRCYNLERSVANIIENIDPSSAVNRGLCKFSLGDSVVCATTTNIALSGLQTIDGVMVNADEYVLVKDQNDPKENGIYIANSGAWSRGEYTVDESENEPVIKGIAGKFFPVLKGTKNSGHIYISIKDIFTVDGETSPDNNIVFADTYYSINPRPNTTVFRTNTGNVQTNTPSKPNDSLNKKYFDDYGDRRYFAVCDTSADIQNKNITIENFGGLKPGVELRILFTNGSSYFYESGNDASWGQCFGLQGTSGNATENTIRQSAAPKISINNGTSYPIKVGGEYAGENFVRPGDIHNFIFDGESFTDVTSDVIYQGETEAGNYVKKRNGLIEQWKKQDTTSMATYIWYFPIIFSNTNYFVSNEGVTADRYINYVHVSDTNPGTNYKCNTSCLVIGN